MRQLDGPGEGAALAGRPVQRGDGVQVLLVGPFADAGLATAILGPGAEPEPVMTGAGAALLVRVPDAAAAERLAFHAAVHGARAEMAELDGTPVERIAPSAQPLAGKRFDGDVPPSATIERWREIWREAAGEILDCLGRQDPAEVQARLMMIWARAESRLRARAAPRPAPSGLDMRNLRLDSVERPYARFFLVEDYVYSHDRFDGGDSGPLTRAAFIMADAVTVLPWDPVRDRVLVIEQVRVSPMARHDPVPWVLEPIAGRIDPGDTPETTAHKEAMEEAGLTLSALHPIAEYYPSTGAFSEYIYAYLGIADLPDGAGQLGGLESEGEDIRGHVMARAELMARIAAGEIPVGPLILSAYWLDANAARLRGSG